MPGNSIGKALVLTTFGESHGMAVGGILDGFPANIPIEPDFIQAEVNRRNPAKYPFATSRREPDELVLLSGIFEGVSTGTPIAFMAYNKDQRPEDYEHLKSLYRPSHADFTYDRKYGIRDYRGGGRASARATLAIVAGGAFAKLLLRRLGIEITAFVSRIGEVALPEDLHSPSSASVAQSPLGCPDEETTRRMIDYLSAVEKAGDTAGGVISCVVRDVPAGLGEPVMDKLQADLGKAMLSINAVKGFDYGEGFAAATMRGSGHNDPFLNKGGKIITATNHSGGIQGGISNGMDIRFRAAFKPVSTLAASQQTVDTTGDPVRFEGKGRHDVCIVPRAIPIVEAMTALVIADHFLRQRTARF